VKIRRIDAFTASLALDGGFAHFGGRVTALEEVFVRVTGEDGLVGWGEVRGNMSYFSGESPAGIVATLRDALAPLVLGRALRERGALLEGCDRAVVGNHAAKAVLDIALHDLAARAAGVPLVQWLGGRRRAELLGSECVFYGPPDVAAAQARRFVADGFRIVKVRVGLEPFGRDVDRVRAVREAVGPGVRMAVDANQAWSVKEAIRRIRTLQAFDIESVEQPVSAGDVTGMAEVARAVTIPLMADESLFSLENAMTLIRLGAAGMFHVKLVKAGGIHRARQLLALAEAARLPVLMGQMNEGMLATATAAHLALASSAKYAELYGSDGIVDDPTPGHVHENGRVRVPDGPGLGVAPDVRKLVPVFSLGASASAPELRVVP
jgi:L-alanine-DL-glutamate epimerase-like enolase superfamily enzyme